MSINNNVLTLSSNTGSPVCNNSMNRQSSKASEWREVTANLFPFFLLTFFWVPTVKQIWSCHSVLYNCVWFLARMVPYIAPNAKCGTTSVCYGARRCSVLLFWRDPSAEWLWRTKGWRIESLCHALRLRSCSLVGEPLFIWVIPLCTPQNPHGSFISQGSIIEDQWLSQRDRKSVV